MSPPFPLVISLFNLIIQSVKGFGGFCSEYLNSAKDYKNLIIEKWPWEAAEVNDTNAFSK